MRNFCCIVYLIIFLFSCNTVKPNKVEVVDELALENGFERDMLQGGDFVITIYKKITNKDLPIVFYIEGDGNIVTGSFVSLDPTPIKPMFIRMAFADPRPNVVYLARPCQYTPMAQNPICNSSFWTDARLSEPVIQSLNAVINSITKGKKFDLVGFSGGGSAAVLIGARNPGTRSILTIAGNLNLALFTKYHSSEPMSKSLDPFNYTDLVANIPQVHISGSNDEVIPSYIVQNFVNKINTGYAKHIIIPNFAHNSDWSSKCLEIIDISIKNTTDLLSKGAEVFHKKNDKIINTRNVKKSELFT